MNKFKNPLIAAAVLACLGLIGSLMNSHPSVLQAAGGPTVTIDPAQLPLHVTGSTTVAGQVAATQSGVWNVGINGTPNVKIVNGLTSPVPVIATPPSELRAAAAFFTASTACTGVGGSLLGAKELSIAFTYPTAGQVFVLTGFSWSLGTAGYAEGFPVGVGLASVSDTSQISSGNIIEISITPNGPNGAAGKTETILPGVVALRPSAGLTHLCMYPDTGGTALQGLAFVHGYFTLDQ